MNCLLDAAVASLRAIGLSSSCNSETFYLISIVVYLFGRRAAWTPKLTDITGVSTKKFEF